MAVAMDRSSFETVQKSLFGDNTEYINIKPVNVASVPHRSPFRYPGGKTWFVPRLREWLHNRPVKPKTFIEPFVGGGIISLTAAFENLADKVLMAELDDEIAAVWSAIVQGDAGWLAEKILSFEMSKENVVNELKVKRKITREKAFQTIIKNRTLHGGILAAGSGFVKNGEAGKGILSRWYPSTLAKRLRAIDLVKEKLTFEKNDALRVIDRHKDDGDAVFFIDPPYTAGGKKAGTRLYTHYELDHEKLFERCAKLQGDFTMTYDNAEEVKSLALRYGFQAKPIPMKNTHHAELTELVIGKDLGWMKGIDKILEDAGTKQINRGRQ